MEKKYFLGIDLGSSSIGWAATNENYDFLRLNGKNAWGSRIFEEAESKKTRRQYRSSRRRMQRRKYRIQLLNELFAKEINKIDKTFFLRLENSTFYLEDKNEQIKTTNILFKTTKEEKDFYKTYPTIWHLRKALIQNEANAFKDIRNIYIAIHHIIKYRGNFLFEGTLDYKQLDSSILNELNIAFNNALQINSEEQIEFISPNNIEALKNTLLNKKSNKTTKQKEIVKLFTPLVEDKTLNELIKMFKTIVCGGKYKIKDMNTNEEISIVFDDKYDENIPKLINILEHKFDIVVCAKKIYDYIYLNELLEDSSFLCESMCKIYEQHKNDLKLLKKTILDLDKKLNLNGADRFYCKVFKPYLDKESNKDNKAKNLNNYYCLIHKKTNYPEFYKFIKEILINNKENINETNFENIISRIENETFLKTIANYSTSAIPHQLHLSELEKIIDNSINFYPFIEDIKEKIIKLFLFKVPYYYGPLNPKSAYSNVVLKEEFINEKVTPFNYDQIVDENKTKDKFIKKLTNECSYLYAEKVLPKVSLYYEKYLILDRLNSLQVNGSKLTKDEKNNCLNYILKRKKTTIADLKKHLETLYFKEILLAGIKEDVPFIATSYSSLCKQFNLDDVNIYDIVDQLIFFATIYADDKKSLKQYLSQMNLTESQIKVILTLPTSKWAPFSKKLLTERFYEDDNGIVYSILDLMEESNENFQQIINNEKYGILRKINDVNNQTKGFQTINEQIEERLEYVPSIFKRSIFQTLNIIDDVIKANHKIAPQKIFIEVTRENDENKKGKETLSRYDELNNFLKSLNKDLQADKNTLISASDISELQQELLRYENEKVYLSGKHLYLYFKQLGYDLYSGEKIKIEDVLSSDKKYDTDHIIPQSLIKDDSLDNLVLVSKKINQTIKKDFYPIPSCIKNNQIINLWKWLHTKKLISDKKYNNLMRNTEISEAELSEFINRQINVVNTSNKVLKDILEIKYPNTKIIFSKAQYPSFLRKEYKIAKNRDLNDAHHAVDAYLNVVTGNILSTYFSNPILNNYKKYHTYNMENIIMNHLTNNHLKDKIILNCLRHDALVTYKTIIEKGAFYKQTIFPKAENNSLIPIHSSTPFKNVTKYGGYTSLFSSYIMAIQYNNEKGKTIKELLRVPLLYEIQYKNKNEEFFKLIIGNSNISNIKLIKKIALNQKIKYDKGIYLLYTSNEFTNKYKMAYQNYLDNDILVYLNKASHELEKRLYLNNNDLIQDSLILQTNKNQEDFFTISKEKNMNILNELILTSKKDVYDTCNYIRKLREFPIKEFESLNLKQQIETLNTFIGLLSRNSESFSLKHIKNLSSNCLRLSTNITSKNISLIFESPSGLFSKEEKI